MEATMSAEAVEVRRNYQREYRRKNQAKINAKRREWRADNRDKVQQYNQQYWERKAGKTRNIRASYADYNISPQRLNELTGIVRSGKYDAVVLSAARKADESAAGHIIMSVKENASYEALEAKQAAGKIERIALGRSDFYGVRRMFFYYLDVALSERQTGKSEEVKNG